MTTMLSGLWHNDLHEIDYLDLNEDEDSFTFETHCARVYNVNQIGKRSLSPVPERSLLNEEMEVGIPAALSRANILPPRGSLQRRSSKAVEEAWG